VPGACDEGPRVRSPLERRWAGRRTSRTVLAALALLVGLAAASATGLLGSARAAVSAPAVSVAQTTNLHDGQAVRITVTGATPGSTLLAVQCSPAALRIGEDGCENHRDQVFFAGRDGRATTTLVVTSTIVTAAGSDSCIRAVCLLGVVRFTAPTKDQIVGVSPLSFSSALCHGGVRCQAAPPIPSTVAHPEGRDPRVRGTLLLTPSRPYRTSVLARAAGNLSSADAITGPYRPGGHRTGAGEDRCHSRAAARCHSRRAPGRARLRLELGPGLLQLSMAGPGTSWASARDKAVTVSVRVDRGPWQTIVLFAGSRPFTYAGFTGPLATGTHRVSVRVDPSLSTTGVHRPDVALYRLRLSVVDPRNPMYLLEKYAPVIYGRADSANSDTQLLSYGTTESLGAGATALSYQTVWSHEDAGTSFVPFLEWGEWGRMTDITATARLHVSARGVISDAMFHWCGCAASFPPDRDSPLEVAVPFHGRYFDGTHMILRNASGNDYQSEVGATEFRFQQPAVSGPAPGQPREAVMDDHPWTYRIMDDEVRYWYLDRSSDPFSAQPGAAPQYAIVTLDTSSAEARTVAVELRLSGSATWYRSDMGSGAPLYTGGLGRTVVKLPLDWQDRRITGVRLAVYPGSALPSLRVIELRILALTPRYAVIRVAAPRPRLEPGRITTRSAGLLSSPASSSGAASGEAGLQPVAAGAATVAP
jgi:hypothetical protein